MVYIGARDFEERKRKAEEEAKRIEAEYKQEQITAEQAAQELASLESGSKYNRVELKDFADENISAPEIRELIEPKIEEQKSPDVYRTPAGFQSNVRETEEGSQVYEPKSKTVQYYYDPEKDTKTYRLDDKIPEGSIPISQEIYQSDKKLKVTETKTPVQVIRQVGGKEWKLPKSARGVIEIIEPIPQKEQKYILGKIPEKEAKIKTWEEMTPEEKGWAIPLPAEITILKGKGLYTGKTYPREYDTRLLRTRKTDVSDSSVSSTDLGKVTPKEEKRDFVAGITVIPKTIAKGAWESFKYAAKPIKTPQESWEVISKPEVQTFLLGAGLAIAPQVIQIPVGLGFIGYQTKETIKEPTPYNIGVLTFMGGTALVGAAAKVKSLAKVSKAKSGGYVVQVKAPFEAAFEYQTSTGKGAILAFTKGKGRISITGRAVAIPETTAGGLLPVVPTPKIYRPILETIPTPKPVGYMGQPPKKQPIVQITAGKGRVIGEIGLKQRTTLMRKELDVIVGKEPAKVEVIGIKTGVTRDKGMSTVSGYSVKTKIGGVERITYLGGMGFEKGGSKIKGFEIIGRGKNKPFTLTEYSGKVMLEERPYSSSEESFKDIWYATETKLFGVKKPQAQKPEITRSLDIFKEIRKDELPQGEMVRGLTSEINIKKTKIRWNEPTGIEITKIPMVKGVIKTRTEFPTGKLITKQKAILKVSELPTAQIKEIVAAQYIGILKQSKVPSVVGARTPKLYKAEGITSLRGESKYPFVSTEEYTGVIPSIEGVTTSIPKTNLIPIMKPSLKPELKPDLFPIIKPSLKPALMPSLKPELKPALQPAIKPALLPLLKPALLPAVKPALKPMVKPALKPALKPVLKPALKPMVKPILKPITTVPPPPKIKLEQINLISVPPQKLDTKGYDALVKRKQLKKGKGSYESRGYEKANKQPLTREAALGLMASVLDTYTNRSGKIKRTNKKAVQRKDLESKWNFIKHKFRESKDKKAIVEKTVHAIDSIEEKQGIPYEAARLRKKGFFTKESTIETAIKKKQKVLANLVSRVKATERIKPKNKVEKLALTLARKNNQVVYGSSAASAYQRTIKPRDIDIGSQSPYSSAKKLQKELLKRKIKAKLEKRFIPQLKKNIYEVGTVSYSPLQESKLKNSILRNQIRQTTISKEVSALAGTISRAKTQYRAKKDYLKLRRIKNILEQKKKAKFKKIISELKSQGENQFINVLDEPPKVLKGKTSKWI